jgi:molybdenum cofactor biosynthesis enzyme MoaA
MLRSENLTITVPSIVHNEKLQNPFCNKNCTYCVSVMTGFTERSGLDIMLRNIDKVKTFAERAQVTSVLLTGKGEPTLNMHDVKRLAWQFREYALELQTNGIRLSRYLDRVDELYECGFDVIAISLDSDADFKRSIPLIKKINDVGMSVRITVNVSDKLHAYGSFNAVFNYAKKYGVLQVLFRKLTSPSNSKSDKASQWIKDHAENGMYESIVSDMNGYIKDRGTQTRVLNTGEIVWSVDEISLVSIDYCLQEMSDGQDLRSIIFHEDGHLYTQWNDNASRLF